MECCFGLPYQLVSLSSTRWWLARDPPNHGKLRNGHPANRVRDVAFSRATAPPREDRYIEQARCAAPNQAVSSPSSPKTNGAEFAKHGRHPATLRNKQSVGSRMPWWGNLQAFDFARDHNAILEAHEAVLGQKRLQSAPFALPPTAIEEKFPLEGTLCQGVG